MDHFPIQKRMSTGIYGGREHISAIPFKKAVRKTRRNLGEIKNFTTKYNKKKSTSINIQRYIKREKTNKMALG